MRPAPAPTQPRRRAVLADAARLAGLLAAAGLLPAAAQAAWNAAAFDARNLAEVARALGAAAPVESREVTLTGPDVAENGASVSVALASTLPGVKRLLLLVEKNPTLLSAILEPGEQVEPAITTRVKMNESSNVFAVAMTADGRLHYARREIRVTLGGCAG
jgi:sulfur-oxidizing protein SoxY